MTTARTHYDVLEVTRDADTAAIKEVYRVLVQVWHPDKVPQHLRERANEKLKLINAAYEVLRDPARRYAYDQSLDLDVATGTDDYDNSRKTREQADSSGARTPGDVAVYRANAVRRLAEHVDNLIVRFPGLRPKLIKSRDWQLQRLEQQLQQAEQSGRPLLPVITTWIASATKAADAKARGQGSA